MRSDCEECVLRCNGKSIEGLILTSYGSATLQTFQVGPRNCLGTFDFESYNEFEPFCFVINREGGHGITLSLSIVHSPSSVRVPLRYIINFYKNRVIAQIRTKMEKRSVLRGGTIMLINLERGCNETAECSIL